MSAFEDINVDDLEDSPVADIKGDSVERISFDETKETFRTNEFDNEEEFLNCKKLTINLDNDFHYTLPLPVDDSDTNPYLRIATTGIWNVLKFIYAWVNFTQGDTDIEHRFNGNLVVFEKIAYSIAQRHIFAPINFKLIGSDLYHKVTEKEIIGCENYKLEYKPQLTGKGYVDCYLTERSEFPRRVIHFECNDILGIKYDFYLSKIEYYDWVSSITYGVKKSDFGKAIEENTDEYGVIHWENIRIPDLDVKDVRIEDVPPTTEDE